MGSAKDPEIARFAREKQACLLTGDFGFANVRMYPPPDFHGIVVFELPRNATASFILRLVESFLQQSEVLRVLPGRLAIVDSSRIRLRPRPD